MKLGTWKLWGMLCAAAVLTIGSGATKAQAVDTNRIYEVTPEEHFTFDVETGMVTGYQDVVVTADLNDTTGEAVNSETEPATVVVVPQTIQGIEVKGFAGAFQGHEAIQKIIIPDTVEVFGDDAFHGCTSLTSISVYQTGEIYREAQVTEKQQQDWNVSYIIAGSAGEVIAPGDTDDAVASDAQSVEEDAAIVIEEPTNPEPVAGEIVYYEITDRGSCAVIPASLKTVGIGTFSDCAIASFDVLEGSEDFRDSDEGGINLQEGVGACLLSYDGTKLYRMAPRFRDQNNSLQYSMPEGIVEILPYAGQALGWQQVEVSNTVQTIDSYAFYQSGLLGITFAQVSQVENIGEWAFAYNDNLDITLPSSVKTIGKYCFAYIANRTPNISGTQITVIPEYTFAGCPNLHTITMPATLQIIENYAFAGNANLNEVVFTGQTLTSIGTGAFQNCTNMHRIDIPSGVKTIEPNTFAGCSNLNEVILPEGLTDIKEGAFVNCQNIHKMVIPSTVTSIAANSFAGSNTREIDTSKNAYAQQAIKGSSQNHVPQPQPAVLKVGYQAKSGNLFYRVTKSPDLKNSSKPVGAVTVVKVSTKSVKKVVIPSSVKLGAYNYQVTAISAKAFAKCKKLKKVTIGVNVKSIGKQAFKNCKKLKTITIKSQKLTKSSVGAGAFQGISKKATIKVPKKKLKAYKKFLRKKGLGKKVKIKK